MIRACRQRTAAGAGGVAGATRPRRSTTSCSARSSTRIAPHTEADPVAILTQLLVSFGAAVGRGAWFQVEATRHHGNEYMCLVGDSARGRKGSSWDHVRRLILAADPSLEPRILTGSHQWRGADLGSPRPHRPGPRHQRSAAAGDRARIRQRPAGLKPRDLDAVTDTALRLGRPAAGDPDPHRPGARQHRAHRADRAHHPARAAPPHHQP